MSEQSLLFGGVSIPAWRFITAFTVCDHCELQTKGKGVNCRTEWYCDSAGHLGKQRVVSFVG
jgi:hypothetical protein